LVLNRVKFKTYTSAIQEFTRRTLSKQEDGINAVQGVLGTLSSQFGSFHCGLPESHFGAALLWGPMEYETIKKYPIEEAPFPSWSWARWKFLNGVNWVTPKASWARLESTAYILTSSQLIEIPSASLKVEEKPALEYADLSRQVQAHLQRVEEMIYMKCTPLHIRIGERVTESTSSHEHPSTIHQYCLDNLGGFVIGHIRMTITEREKCGDKVQTLLKVCLSTGYEGPPIEKHLIPTKRVNKGDSESPNWVTVNQEPYEFLVANVFLVKWTNEMAERVAIGHVVLGAVKRWTDDREWVLFG
jgi:hypothetical protein